MKEHVALGQELRECITEENPFFLLSGRLAFAGWTRWQPRAQEEWGKAEVCTCLVTSENSRNVWVLLEHRWGHAWGGLGPGRPVGRIAKDQTSESELDSNNELHGDRV